MEFNQVLGFSSRGSEFPSFDGLFGYLNEQWAASHGFDPFHASILSHNRQHLDRSSDVHVLRHLGVDRVYLPNDLATLLF